MKITFTFTFAPKENTSVPAAVKFELPEEWTGHNETLTRHFAKATLEKNGDMTIPAANFPTYSCDSGGNALNSWWTTVSGTDDNIHIAQPAEADKRKAVTISAEDLQGVGATNFITLQASSDSGGASFNGS